MSYELGDLVPVSITITDSTGNPANAGSVTLTVTLPDGTTDVRTNVAGTIGVYEVDYQSVQAGRHGVRWVATGSNASAFTDAFTVDPSDGGDFISLADARKFLQKSTADDASIAGMVSTACQMIRDRMGPVSPETFTHYVRTQHCGRLLVLDADPVIAVTSFTVNGVTVDPSTYRVGLGSGIITRVGHWPTGDAIITYRAGRTPLPANYRLAALELTAHLWRTTQLNASAARPGLSGGDALEMRNVPYALPLRVREELGLGKLPNNRLLI